VEIFVTDTWNPIQYGKFQREREQPFFDLMALVRPAPDMRVVDLGCGTGRQTEVLHAHLHARETIGIDRSARMLEAILAEPLPGGLRFEVGTIESFAADSGRAGTRDLIFSNAAFHWVEDHEELLKVLASALAPSGQLAFQMPAQHDAWSHVVAEDLTDVEPFRSAFGGWHRPQPVLAPEAYARLLYRYGFADPKVQLIVYPHVLASREAVVEWVKGTLLTEYARHLPPELFDRFVDEYRTRLLARLEDARPFFYPFTRILCWGQRA
jgi:trans-aconitate 2-methyltransferase